MLFPCWLKFSTMHVVRYYFIFCKYKNHEEIVLCFLRECRKEEKVSLCSEVNIISKFWVRYFRDSQIFSVSRGSVLSMKNSEQAPKGITSSMNPLYPYAMLFEGSPWCPILLVAIKAGIGWKKVFQVLWLICFLFLFPFKDMPSISNKKFWNQHFWCLVASVAHVTFLAIVMNSLLA